MADYSTLSGAPPIIIAHRGASGYLPEHTLEAYQLAIAQGADFIEPDLVITQDGVLIARHEPNLITTTNVADWSEFGDRRRTKTVDGISQVGFYAQDFTLAEIKQLRARQSHLNRNQSHNDRFEIPTLAEIIALVQQTETAIGRKVGIYPETKHPTNCETWGLPLEEPLIETLVASQFTDPKRVFIQSFEVSNLKDKLPRLMGAAGIALPLVQLFGEFQQRPYDFVIKGDSRTYGDLIHPDSLREFVASYASAIGVWKRSFVLTELTGAIASAASASASPVTERLTGKVLPIVEAAHASGLLVHPYTFRNEPHFLAQDYDSDPATEYEQFFALGVDGVFSDFPDTALQVRDTHKGKYIDCKS
jgi:glycerophosphoryl diester phosphodiesterase